MKVKNDEVADYSSARVYINIVIVVVFLVLMAVCIAYFFRSEPNVNNRILEGFSRQFQQSSETAHWQWQAQGRPERIMLAHYDINGKEIARHPVKIGSQGKPWIDKTSNGCEKLWQSLLNEPTLISGFKVISEYFSPEKGRKQELGFCRYRLSQGASFDYNLATGVVEFTNN